MAGELVMDPSLVAHLARPSSVSCLPSLVVHP
jgi:hypothetical protein